MFNGFLTPVQFFVALVVALGSFCYGYSVNITSTTLGQPSFLAYMKLDGSARATALTSAIGVGAFCGATIGVAILPLGADRMGRKFNLYLFAGVLIVAGALQAGSVNSSMFVFTRVLVGVACGALFTSVPIYQSEVAPAHLRGALIACHGTLFCLGSVVGQWLNVIFYHTKGDIPWRTPLALQVVWPIMLLITLRWVPESPRFLITKGRNDEALAILRRLHYNPRYPDENLAEKEYEAIVALERLERDANTKWSDLFATPANRKRTFIACFIGFFYAWTGINVIAGYLASLFTGLGLTSFQGTILTAGAISISPWGNFFAGFMVDRWGRKPMFLACFAICTAALCIQVGVDLRALDTSSGQIAGVFSIFLFFVGFTTFYDVPCWCYTSEIWPQHLRAKGFAPSLFCYFIGNVITVGVAPTAFASIGAYFYFVFIGAMILAAPLFWFYFPETKNLTLEDMGPLFGEEPHSTVPTVTLEAGGKKTDGEVMGDDIKGIA